MSTIPNWELVKTKNTFQSLKQIEIIARKIRIVLHTSYVFSEIEISALKIKFKYN